MLANIMSCVLSVLLTLHLIVQNQRGPLSLPAMEQFSDFDMLI